MKGEKIYIALGGVDDELIERCTVSEKSKRSINMHWVNQHAIAACLCLILIGIITLTKPFNIIDDGVSHTVVETTPQTIAPTANQTENNATQDDIIYVPSGKIVDGFTSDSGSACYAAPKKGTWFCFIEVNEALKKNIGKDVTYFLAINIFSDQGQLDYRSKEAEAELERLTRLGYHVGYAERWEYVDSYSKDYYKYIAGYFTAEELENFSANEHYGYAFSFATNNDGSPVSGKQGIIKVKP